MSWFPSLGVVRLFVVQSSSFHVSAGLTCALFCLAFMLIFWSKEQCPPWTEDWQLPSLSCSRLRYSDGASTRPDRRQSKHLHLRQSRSKHRHLPQDPSKRLHFARSPSKHLHLTRWQRILPRLDSGWHLTAHISS